MQLVKAAHIIANENPQKCISEVETFIEKKSNAEVTYSTTALMVGISANQAQLSIVTSALIRWECSQDDYKAFQNRLQLIG